MDIIMIHLVKIDGRGKLRRYVFHVLRNGKNSPSVPAKDNVFTVTAATQVV